MRSKIHREIGSVNIGGAFREFREALAIACGRKEITVEGLGLDFSQSHRRPYGSCLGRDFILKMMSDELAEKIDILRNIIGIAGIHYVCPCCWSGFATSANVLEHCGKEKDEYHQGLLSKKVAPFVEIYGELMGRSIDFTTLDIDYDGHGVPDFHRCFEIDEVLKQRSWYQGRLDYKKGMGYGLGHIVFDDLDGDLYLSQKKD
ncbi:uncharacterized protein N7506_005621 [Penicillium brevicompactum]|uniref:uncharacterized protein n=1 Tax=Penicillium brevicompactum TaxID=5074 RepID=UPI002540B9E3|nr:uncharacterized protein N7506_005621 [Penicillium brevicompactum]KAJ5335685.1 hypothetical protein N7506_005621 [Penicillium brevicompactum]